MKKIILLISAVLLTVAIYATNVVIKNTDVTTPSGTLNVSVEQYTTASMTCWKVSLPIMPRMCL